VTDEIVVIPRHFSCVGQSYPQNKIQSVFTPSSLQPREPITPSQTLASGISATPRTLTFNSSLALGAEFDHRLNMSKRLGVLAGVDFLASPLDVKLDQRRASVIPGYAYVFLTPHVRLKFLRLLKQFGLEMLETEGFHSPIRRLDQPWCANS
jgi:hypothetical protein